MTERLESFIEELILLARETAAGSLPGFSNANRAPTLYSWRAVRGDQEPPSEQSIVTRAVSSRLARLWLDTFYETELASLYVEVSNREPGAPPRLHLDQLQHHWCDIARIDSPATDAIRPLLKRWRSGRSSITQFLARSAEAIGESCAGPLTGIIASYANAIGGKWTSAANTARQASHYDNSGRAVSMRLMAANLYLVAGYTNDCLACLNPEDHQNKSFAPQALRALAAAQNEDRSILAEASYWLDELGPEYDARIESSAIRRSLRIRQGLQASPKRFKDVAAFRGLHLGSNSKRLLLW